MRSCGGCTLCCKVMAIDELAKPMGVWCAECRPGKGCAIYGGHPQSCRDFACHWLLDPSMAEAARPDRSKVVLNREGDNLVARCDPGFPSAWRKEPIRGYLREAATRGAGHGVRVLAAAGARAWLITPTEAIELGEVDPHSPFVVETLSDGSTRVRVLPPLAEGEAFDPAAIAAGLGYR